MSFMWLIWMLVFVILLGSERHYWGGLWGDSWGESWGDGNLFSGRRGIDHLSRKTDFEIRIEARKHTQPDVVMVSADDYIDKPDPDLERLISEGKIKEAREHRAAMEKIAEEMDDDAGLKKYAIYGARIARKGKAVAMQERKIMLESPMEIPTATDHKHPSAMEFGEKAASDVAGIAAASTESHPTAPPLWKTKHSTAPAPESKDFTPPKPVMKKPDKPAAIIPEPVIPMYEKPIPVIQKPEPVKQVYEKPKPLFEKPEPVTIPKDFTPPPSGPVTLGTTGGSSGYAAGPVDLDAKLAKKEKDALEAKDKEKEKDKEKKEAEEKINPDDYGDLISL
jgi:hypothetical protein